MLPGTSPTSSEGNTTVSSWQDMQLLIGPEAECLGWYKGRLWEKKGRCWERQEKKKGQLKSQEAIAVSYDSGQGTGTMNMANMQVVRVVSSGNIYCLDF